MLNKYASTVLLKHYSEERTSQEKKKKKEILNFYSYKDCKDKSPINETWK